MTEVPSPKKDVVPAEYRERYKASGGTNGDFIAQALQGVGKDGLPALHAVMRENGIPEKRWASLNVGQNRMNLSNVLRSQFLKGEDIYILGKQYNVRHMVEDYKGAKLTADKPDTFKRFAAHIDMSDNDRTVNALIRTFFPPVKKSAINAEERATIKAQKDADKELARKQKTEATAKAKADKEAAAKVKADEKAAAKAAKPVRAKALETA